MDVIPDGALATVFRFVAADSNIHDASQLPRVCRRWRLLCADETARNREIAAIRGDPAIRERRTNWPALWSLLTGLRFTKPPSTFDTCTKTLIVLGKVLESATPDTTTFVFSPRRFGTTRAIIYQTFWLLTRRPGVSVRVVTSNAKQAGKVRLCICTIFKESLSNTCISGFTGFDGTVCRLGNGANVHVEPVCVPKREDDICILDNIYDPGNGLTCEEIIHRWSHPHNILIVMNSGHEMREGADALSAETDRVTSLYLSRGGFSIRH